MKKILTAVEVVLVSTIIMLLPQLFHTGFQLAEVDWQNVVVNSLIVDASVYVAFAYANRSKVENQINK